MGYVVLTYDPIGQGEEPRALGLRARAQAAELEPQVRKLLGAGRGGGARGVWSGECEERGGWVGPDCVQRAVREAPDRADDDEQAGREDQHAGLDR